MKSTELRIGNYLRYRDEWYCEVQTIGSYFETHNKDLTDRLYGILCGSDDLNDYNPIPLTEEWLIKLGAKKKYNGFYEFDRFYLTWLPSFKYWYVTEKCNIGYITKVEFVHEWQNVVFTLNGQELEVKT